MRIPLPLALVAFLALTGCVKIPDELTIIVEAPEVETQLAAIAHNLEALAATQDLSDNDGDDIPANRDRCPDEAEDHDSFQDHDGCPDLDNDGDSILDVLDKCPGADFTTSTGEDLDSFEDEDGCPDLDNDGDGILDNDDTCPDEGEDLDSFEDEDGCPDPDNDEDGTLDSADTCPNLAHGVVKKDSDPQDWVYSGNGCPNCVFMHPGFSEFTDMELIDMDSCPDADEDGFTDIEDKCPGLAHNYDNYDSVELAMEAYAALGAASPGNGCPVITAPPESRGEQVVPPVE